ncbi:MAG: pilus assembly protein PilM [bacterium]
MPKINKSQETIGIYITPSQVTIVEIERNARRLVLVNYAILSHSIANKEELANFIKESMISKGFKLGNTAVAITGTSIRHKSFSIPAMSKKEMPFAVRKEVSKLCNRPVGEIAYDFFIKDDSPKKSLTARDILIATSDLKDVEETLTIVNKANLIPFVVTTASLAILNIYLQLKDIKNELVIFLYVTGEYNHLVAISNGELFFCRDFSLGIKLDSLSDLTKNNVAFDWIKTNISEKVISELNRILQYIKQIDKNKEVKKIFVSGKIDKIKESLLQGIEDTYKIETKVFDLIGLEILNIDKIESMEELIKICPELVIPLGAVCKKVNEGQINLLPGEIKKKRKSFFVEYAIVSVNLVFIIGLYILSTPTTKKIGDNKSEIDRVNKNIEEINNELEDINNIIQIRGAHKARLNKLKSIKKTGTVWLTFFSRLSCISIKEVQLKNLTLEDKKEYYDLKLTGEIVGQHAAKLMDSFNDYYNKFKKLPNLKEVKYRPLDIKTSFDFANKTSGENNQQVISKADLVVTAKLFKD